MGGRPPTQCGGLCSLQLPHDKRQRCKRQVVLTHLMCLMRESAPGVSVALGGGSDVSTSDFTHSGISITGVELLASSVACHGTQIERRMQMSMVFYMRAPTQTSSQLRARRGQENISHPGTPTPKNTHTSTHRTAQTHSQSHALAWMHHTHTHMHTQRHSHSHSRTHHPHTPWLL
jgi:hypothetical protein